MLNHNKRHITLETHFSIRKVSFCKIPKSLARLIIQPVFKKGVSTHFFINSLQYVDIVSNWSNNRGIENRKTGDTK